MTRLACIAVLLCASTALAAEPPTCPPDDGTVESSTRLLRSLSIDLRGVVPTVDEYAQATVDGAPDALIQQWLDSEQFTAQVVRHHRSLMWSNVTNVDIIDNDSRLTEIDDIWYVDDDPSLTFRGVNDLHCGDFEASFGPNGEILTVPGGGGIQEGWVWVDPYWDPGTPIKVCAFDAQTERTSPNGTDCASRDWEDDPACGCGPNLDWCRVNGIEEIITGSFGTDIDLRVARIVDQDRSYLDLFQDDSGFVNGPMAHFYAHQTGKPDDVDFAPGQIDAARIPDLAFTDVDTYEEIPLGTHHAGILTSPAWLLRFQTHRARANRFYNAFLCQPFQPPDGGLTGLDDPNPTLDLTARDGCQYCHALLEPAAAHWGRWPQAGAGHLDESAFPAFDAECESCAIEGDVCSQKCRDHYQVAPISAEQYPFLGWLQSYEFLEERHADHVEMGPELLVNSTVADGRLPACVATKTAEWLIGREMTDDDAPWIDALSDDFITSDFRYKDLVKAIVTSDNYRRVP